MTAAIHELLLRDSATLDTVSTTPLLDCQIILCDVLGRDRAWLYSHDDEVLDDTQLRRYRAAIARRQQGEPIAYIIGRRDFWHRSFWVTPDTLIPRPETELLIEVLLARFDNAPRTVVDLGTGTGAIAISLAAERPAWQVTGIDHSEAALAVARENGSDLDNVEFKHGSWCEDLDTSSIDIIVSNPPYVRTDDPHLAALNYEPASALEAGADGLDDIRVIIRDSFDCLKPGGTLMLEHGYDQQPAIVQLLQERGYTGVETFSDLNGNPRAVLAERPA